MVTFAAHGYPLSYGDSSMTLEVDAAARGRLAQLVLAFSRQAVGFAWRGWRVVEGIWPNYVSGRATFSGRDSESNLSDGLVSLNERGFSWTYWPEPGRVLVSEPWADRDAGFESPKRAIDAAMFPLRGSFRTRTVECDAGHWMAIDMTPERREAVRGLEAEASYWRRSADPSKCFLLADRFGTRLHRPSGEFVPLWSSEVRVFQEGLDWMFCLQDLVHVWSRRMTFEELLSS